jgi:hypothetical protein
MTINILDDEINDHFKNNLVVQKDGIRLIFLNSEGKTLYDGIVWPNE